MQSINSIFVIYNPNSTGPAKKNALELQQLLSGNTSIDCTLLETKHESHAIELAKQSAGEGVMLVSSSGDGGFHELINGVMATSNPSATLVGLLPSGNANDHYHTRHSGELIDRIVQNDYSTMDLLKVSWNDTTVYAHSYVGLGITANIGETLTQHQLNPLREALIVIRGLLKPCTVRIVIDGQTRRYDSFVMNLIGQMAKYITTGEKNRPTDGTFDVMTKQHTSVIDLLRHLFRHAITNDITDATSHESLEFTTTRPAQMQLDGEIYRLSTKTVVSVSCVPDALRYII